MEQANPQEPDATTRIGVHLAEKAAHLAEGGEIDAVLISAAALDGTVKAALARASVKLLVVDDGAPALASRIEEAERIHGDGLDLPRCAHRGGDREAPLDAHPLDQRADGGLSEGLGVMIRWTGNAAPTSSHSSNAFHAASPSVARGSSR